MRFCHNVPSGCFPHLAFGKARLTDWFSGSLLDQVALALFCLGVATGLRGYC